jgi:hypothetical protein
MSTASTRATAASTSSCGKTEAVRLRPEGRRRGQIYDGFSASVIYGLESYGFCKEGEALDFIQDGHMELDGELPLNTFSGSLGTGRIHGLWHIIEGLGPRRLAPGQRRQRLLRRRQRPDRNRHDLHLRRRSLVGSRATDGVQTSPSGGERVNDPEATWVASCQ